MVGAKRCAALAHLITLIRVLIALSRRQIERHQQIVLGAQRFEAYAEGEMRPKPEQIVRLPQRKIVAVDDHERGEPIDVRECGHKEAPHEPEFEAAPVHPSSIVGPRICVPQLRYYGH